MAARYMSRDEVRDVDRRAIEEYGLLGVVLMENAGRGCTDLLLSLGVQGPIVICAGKGNNGGDGFVIARHLENHGVPVRVLLFASPEDLHGDAAVNYRVLEASGTPIRTIAAPTRAIVDTELAGAEWIVDALLGTGTRGEIREPFLTVIQSINSASAQVLAVDLPSGMDCDTGESLGGCVVAKHTATFVAPKLGFQFDASNRFTGTVHVVDIGVPKAMLV